MSKKIASIGLISVLSIGAAFGGYRAFRTHRARAITLGAEGERHLLHPLDQQLLKKLGDELFTGKRNDWSVLATRQLLQVSSDFGRLALEADASQDRILRSNQEQIRILLEQAPKKTGKVNLRVRLETALKQITEILALPSAGRAAGVKERSSDLDVRWRSGGQNSITAFIRPASHLPADQVPADVQDKLSWIGTQKAWLMSRNDSKTCQSVAVTNPDPNGDALTGTDLFTQRSADVTKIATQLGTPEAAFAFVRDQIQFLADFGAAQTAAQVLRSSYGTGADKATLLIALLRAQGVAAQYVMGEMQMDEDSLKDLYGVESSLDLYWAHTYLVSRYFNDSLGVFDPNRVVAFKSGARVWTVPHVWVNAFIHGSWTQLDSLLPPKDHRNFPAFPVLSAVATQLTPWLFDPDFLGRIIKPGALVDDLRRRSGTTFSDASGSGHKMQLAFSPANLSAPILSGDACVEAQANLIPAQYQFLSQVKVGPAASPLIDVTVPVAQVRGGPVYLAHSSGLLGEGASGAGDIQLKSGDQILASAPATPGDALAFYHAVIFPVRYGASHTVTRNTPGVVAGGVDVVNHSLAPINEADLDEEIGIIRALQASGATHQQLMVRFLRLAALLAVTKSQESSEYLQKIRGVNATNQNLMTTDTVIGQVVDRQDRVLGQIPVGGNIDWTSFGATFSRSGSFSNHDSYSNISQFVGEEVATDSSYEHGIWENLYGVPSVSTIKILQAAADGNAHGSPTDLIKGVLLTAESAPQIYARFGQGMQQFVSYLNGVISDQPLIYSLTNTLYLPTGWSGVGLLTFPTKPTGGAAALIATYTQGTLQGGANVGPPTNTQTAQFGNGAYGTSGGCSKGAPVNVATGSMWHVFKDFNIPGRTPETSIPFQRTYLSKTFVSTGDLGPHWVHNWETRLYTLTATDGQPTGDMLWIDEDGSEWTFTRQTNGSFTSPPGQFSILTQFADHTELKKKGGTVLTFAKTGPEPAGRLRSIREPHGEMLTVSYDSSGLLASVQAPLAGTVQFHRDTQGRIDQVIRVRDGLTYLLAYDANGNLSQSTDFSNHATTYEYISNMAGTAAQGLMSAFVDPLMRRTEFTYYKDGRVFTQTDPGGGARTFIYSPFASNLFTREREPDGGTREYRLDNNFRVIETVDPTGASEQAQWTDNGLLVSSTDALGFETDFQYDSHGNQTGVKRPEDGRFRTFAYEPTFDRLTQAVPITGTTTDITIDPLTGDQTRIQQSDGTTALSLGFTRDAFGHLLQTTSDRGSYAHTTNSDGLYTQIFDARNPETRTYDSRGRVATRHFTSGRGLQISYDDFDRVTQITDTAGPTLSQNYDAMGRLLSRTLSDGATSQVTHYEWDALDRLVATTDALSRRMEYRYDRPSCGCRILERPTEIVDPAGRITHFEYDARLQLVRTTDPKGGVTQNEYNPRGDLASVTDAAGNRTVFRYDGNGRLIRRERPGMATGSQGKPVAATQVTRYLYNGADQVVREENVISSFTPGSPELLLVTALQYDGLGRLTRKTLRKERGGQLVEVQDDSIYAYQAQLDVTRLAQANNGVAQESFSSEALPPYATTGFGVAATQAGNPLALIEDQFAVTPDVTGQMALVQGAQTGSSFASTYDPAARLTQINAHFGTAAGLTSGISYDSYGRKVSVTHSTGLTGTLGYDLLNRISTIQWSGAGESFLEAPSYDALTGNITSVQRESGRFDYGYDSTDQLTSVNHVGGADLGPTVTNRAWTYDSTGNRLNDSVNGAGVFQHNVLLEDGKNVYFTDTDGQGNLAQKTSKATGQVDQFSHRMDGKVTQFKRWIQGVGAPSLTGEYYFDALGRRIAKRVGIGSASFMQSFVFSGEEDKILVGKTGEGNLLAYLDGQGIDEHLGAVGTTAGAFGYVTDHLGTVTNGEALNEKRASGAFGEPLGAAVLISAQSDPAMYGYTGRSLDAESGEYYYRARNYEPESGRFSSLDPIGFAGGDVNLYRYANNSPTNFTDASGNGGQFQAVVAGAIVGGALIFTGAVVGSAVVTVAAAAAAGGAIYSVVHGFLGSGAVTTVNVASAYIIGTAVGYALTRTLSGAAAGGTAGVIYEVGNQLISSAFGSERSSGTCGAWGN